MLSCPFWSFLDDVKGKGIVELMTRKFQLIGLN